jgi:Fe-S-cluster containining protein
MERTRRLLALFDEVGARAATLAREHAGWPCTRGCGACCRSLARVPELTRSEWELLAAALDGLSDVERESCRERARTLASSVRDHGGDQRCECPLFDPHSETCRVYAARPLACRSYGFYAGRQHDAWCELVAAHVADTRDQLRLGNLDAVEAELGRIDSERRSLLDWLGLAGV